MSLQQRLIEVKQRRTEFQQEMREIENWFHKLEQKITSMMSKQQEVTQIYSAQQVSSQPGYPTVLRAKEVAEILGVSERRAYEIMDLKGFPLIRIGRSKRVNQQSFFKWLEQQQQLENII